LIGQKGKIPFSLKVRTPPSLISGMSSTTDASIGTKTTNSSSEGSSSFSGWIS